MDANIAVTQFTAAGVAVWAIQKLKTTPLFPMISEASHLWVKRLVSVAAAISIHTGIGYVWNPGTEPGTHVLIINIPTIGAIVVTVWHWIGQFVMQEGWYQVAFNKSVPTSEQEPKP